MTPADIPSLVAEAESFLREQISSDAPFWADTDDAQCERVQMLHWLAEFAALSPKESALIKPPREYEVSGDAVGGGEAAAEAIEAVRLTEAAEDANSNCDDCGGEGIPECCPTCFPLFDEARLRRRRALALAGIMPREFADGIAPLRTPAVEGIPAGMVAWNGGGSAPEDWDGGPVFYANGLTEQPLDDGDWQRPAAIPLLAYTPKARPTASDGEARERIRSEVINSPETADFMAGVPLEAAHQRERWGTSHDAGKSPFDWFWLVGYLAQKAASSAVAGDTEKAMHHTISTAAALANWHAALSGADTAMRPGIDPEQGCAA